MLIVTVKIKARKSYVDYNHIQYVTYHVVAKKVHLRNVMYGTVQIK
jgi:hypothetical protein